MGNHRFRLSDMLPNSWFYKLKDMGRAGRIRESVNRNPPTSTTRGSTTTPKPPPQPNQAYLPNRASYYFPSKERVVASLPHSPFHPKASDTHFPIDPPRKSTHRTRRRPTKPFPDMVSSSSVSASCNCRANSTSARNPESIPESSLYRHDDYDDDDDDLCKPIVSEQLELDGLQVASSASNITSNVGRKGPSDRFECFEAMKSISELKLPPIVTKPMKKEVDKTQVDDRNASGKQGSHPHTCNMKETSKSPARRSIQRIKVRASSPRLGNKKLQARRSQKTVGLKAAMQQRKGLMEGFVVVKSSLDPRRDFRESMVEMIVENNLRASKDLEELLACYLSLNSKVYHDVIIEVFEQIWFDLADIIL